MYRRIRAAIAATCLVTGLGVSANAQEFTIEKKDVKGAEFPPPEEKETTWIEIELVNEADQPVPSERYEIKQGDEIIKKGTLDVNGHARVTVVEPGSCEICFPDLDQEAWEFIESTGPRQEEG